MSDTEGQGLVEEDGDGFTFDMTQTEADKGFEPLPAGVYDTTIEELEYKLSASSGKPMWAMKLAVVGPAEWADKNRKLFFNQSWAENMRERGKAMLLKVAPELTTVTNFNPKKVADEGVMLGKPMRVKVAIKLYQGEKRNEVKDVLTPSAGGASAGGFTL